MKREDTKTKVNDPMSTVPTDKKLNVTPGSMPKGEWTVEYTPSSPMRGRRRGERTYAQADVYSGELINGGKRCYPDGREEPLYREVIHMAFNDQDPDRVARAEAICVLIADAGAPSKRHHSGIAMRRFLLLLYPSRIEREWESDPTGLPQSTVSSTLYCSSRTSASAFFLSAGLSWRR